MKKYVTLSRRFLNDFIRHPKEVQDVIVSLAEIVPPRGMKVVKVTVKDLIDEETETHKTLQIIHVRFESV